MRYVILKQLIRAGSIILRHGHRHSVFSFAFGSAGSSQLAAIGFVCINMHVERLLTHRQLARDLLRTALQAEQHIRLAHDPLLDLTRIETALRASHRQFTGLIGQIATAAFVAAKLKAYRGLVARKLLSNL